MSKSATKGQILLTDQELTPDHIQDSEISPKQESLAVSPAAPAALTTNPLAMVADAVQKGMSPEIIRQLMDLAERAQANEARNAFNRAFAAFKAEATKIVKNITITDGPLKGKKYANLFAAVDAVTPALSKHGLSHSWKLTKDEPAWLEVTCIIRHELGHSETVSMGGPPDTGGAKSPIQARASSKSYLERYTLLAITGLASSEEDDDGASQLDAEMTKLLGDITGSMTVKEMQEAFKIAFRAASAKNNKNALYLATKARDKWMEDLRGGSNESN